MNFGHVCDSVWQALGAGSVCDSAVMALVASGACLVCVALAGRYDAFAVNGQLNRPHNLLLRTATLSVLLTQALCLSFRESLLLGWILGALLFACITDCQECQVYCFTWWIGGSAAVVWLLSVLGRGVPVPWAEWLCYCILQEAVFFKAYGRADCHAFCVCGAVYTVLGRGFSYYLLHMTISMVLLAFFQWRKGNIASSGKLYEPVPFMPYIVLAFMLTLLAV